MKLRSKYNMGDIPINNFEGSNITQPSMTLTIPEILNRHRTGRPIPDLSKNVYYDNEMMLTEPHLSDFDEKIEMVENMKERVEELTNEVELRKKMHQDVLDNLVLIDTDKKEKIQETEK